MTVKLIAIGLRSVRIRSVGKVRRGQNARSSDDRGSCSLRKEFVADAGTSKGKSN